MASSNERVSPVAVASVKAVSSSLVRNQARSLARAGNVAAARTAYEDFLLLWKDADLDVPILAQAKADYAKLQ